MKVLRKVVPTPEQLKIINDYKPGVSVIRGAAGSGKTTTALLRLRFLVNFWAIRLRRANLNRAVRVLVLTFNRTLHGYIEELARDQMPQGVPVDLTVTTFGKWSYNVFRPNSIVDDECLQAVVRRLKSNITLDVPFLANEIEYATGRYIPEELPQYVDCIREGRGKSPRVDRALRQRLLAEIITPYQDWKDSTGYVDWNDLAVSMARRQAPDVYDIIIADESQDFSANLVRAILNHVGADYSLTFILDATQRIYPRFFQWKEVGITLPASAVFTLALNFRNTAEIAAFARPLVEQLDLDEDGTLPDLKSCSKHGAKPQLLLGNFSKQVAYAIDYIERYIDLTSESVAFLQVRGGRWFEFTRSRLGAAGIEFVDIARQNEWPTGPENVALSTLHSAKGLEFDHVFILGLNSEVTPHGQGESDADLENFLRLVAMAICRARNSVLLGYKPGEESAVVQYLDSDTYDRIVL